MRCDGTDQNTQEMPKLGNNNCCVTPSKNEQAERRTQKYGYPNYQQPSPGYHLHDSEEDQYQDTTQDDPKLTLRCGDLKGNAGQKPPVTPMEVYERCNTLASKQDLQVVRRTIKNVIFPHTKFILFRDLEMKREQWDAVTNFEEQRKRVPGKLMESLGVLQKGDIECAIYWNTYKGEVMRTLSQARSTVMSHIKRTIVPGKLKKDVQ